MLCFSFSKKFTTSQRVICLLSLLRSLLSYFSLKFLLYQHIAAFSYYSNNSLSLVLMHNQNKFFSSLALFPKLPIFALIILILYSQSQLVANCSIFIYKVVLFLWALLMFQLSYNFCINLIAFFIIIVIEKICVKITT